jgi:hypothetical protein
VHASPAALSFGGDVSVALLLATAGDGTEGEEAGCCTAALEACAGGITGAGVITAGAAAEGTTAEEDSAAGGAGWAAEEEGVVVSLLPALRVLPLTVAFWSWSPSVQGLRIVGAPGAWLAYSPPYSTLGPGLG